MPAGARTKLIGDDPARGGGQRRMELHATWAEPVTPSAAHRRAGHRRRRSMADVARRITEAAQVAAVVEPELAQDFVPRTEQPAVNTGPPAGTRGAFCPLVRSRSRWSNTAGPGRVIRHPTGGGAGRGRGQGPAPNTPPAPPPQRSAAGDARVGRRCRGGHRPAGRAGALSSAVAGLHAVSIHESCRGRPPGSAARDFWAWAGGELL